MSPRIVYASDEAYAMPLAVSIRSLIDNSAEASDLSVTILARDISDATLDNVIKSCPEISPNIIVVPEENVAGLPVLKYITVTAYLRLLIPSLLPDNGPVIYLDADTVVVADIRELHETPLEGRPLGAVPDPAVPRVDAPGGVQHWAELGIPGSTPYFNSGILLMDPEAWRELRIAEETLAYLRRHGNRIYLDQEALNAVLRGNWLPLDLAWNVYPEFAGTVRVARLLGRELPLPDEHSRALTNPKIVQFVGEDKPWLKAGMRAPFSRTFYHYLDRTAWSGWRPE